VSASLVLPADAPRGDWLAARHTGIGASDIAAVLGISPWQSAFSLHWQKANGWTDEVDNEHTEAGRRLESAIADWAADRIDPNEELFVCPSGLYRSAERPWQMATPDRLLYVRCPDCNGPGALPDTWEWACCRGSGRQRYPVAVLECKHPYDWDGFGDDGTDDIPVYYRTQVLQQCDVMDVGEWYLAAYTSHQLRIYHGRRDDKDIAILRAAGARFWTDLQNGVVPELDSHEATIATLKRLHPSVEDIDIEVPIEFAEGYRRARAMRSRADDLVDRYEARARALLGNARRLTCNRKLVVSRSVYDQSGDSAELTALEGDWPTVDRLNPGRSASYL